MKNFYSVYDVDDINALLERCHEIKKNPHENLEQGKNKLLVLLFFNPSLRTRLSTQKAAYNLGMDVICMNMAEGWKWEMEDGSIMKFDTAEHIKDAARVISTYADIIGVRTFPTLKNQSEDYKDKVINALMKYSTVPVLNMESSILHPLQSLTDLFTIRDKKGNESLKVVLSWAPHPKALPQAVSNSFLEWMHAANIDVTICNPEGYDLDPRFTKGHQIVHSQLEAFKDADVVYVKNWSSLENYGQASDQNEEWVITKEKLGKTNNALLMHCLPVRRNVVISDDALDSENSVVIEQAGNRAVAAQAILERLLVKNS